MNNNIKIGIVSIDSPEDKKTSSGTLYTIYNNLRQIGDVTWIPVNIGVRYNVLKCLTKLLFKLIHINVCFSHTKLGAKLISSGIDNCKFDECDVLIAYWSGAYWGTVDRKVKPTVYISDATFPGMIDYYPPFCNLPKWNIISGIKLESNTLNNSSSIVLSSDWSARSAIEELNQPSQKVHVLEFGANIIEKDVKVRTSKKCGAPLHILFLGVEWERKGGDIAVETVKWLNANGYPSILHIVGIKELNQEINNLPYIKHIGFLNKNDSKDYQTLITEMNICDMLLLPTKAECSAIAFSEASAYGLPIFTHNTGGISNYIEEGRNGYMLPMGSNGKDFGELIADCISNGQLIKMSDSAKEVYKAKLNWGVWTNKMRDIIMNLVKEDRY